MNLGSGLRVAAVSAGLSDPSSTRLLADRLADATVTALAVREQSAEIEVIELRPLAHDITNAMLTGFTADKLSIALDTLAGADAVIAVTPVFQASYSGLFKSFLDVLTIDHEQALRGAPVLLGATAGTARHSLVLESAMRPLFSYLGALTVPTGVFAATDDWGSTGSSAADPLVDGLATRISRAADELAELVVRLPKRTSRPSNEIDFSQLLSR